jgi:hypothetical protein
MVNVLAAFEAPPNVPLKLDIGCGPNPKEGFEGVDQYSFDGKVKHVLDVRSIPWAFADSSVGEIHCSHFLEHLTGVERCAFMNECARVIAPQGKMTVIVPHWASNRAYGDPTHAWPPVSEMWFYYLDREWRLCNAPHTDKAHWIHGYDCDFLATWGYTMRPDLGVRNQEYQQFAMQNHKEAIMDTHATLVNRKK